MNKNIMKLAFPAIIAGIGLANTGCIATRCYETYPEMRLETTYVTTPVVETTYVTTPVVETTYVEYPTHWTIHTPPPRRMHTAQRRPHVAPRRPAPRPQTKILHKAKPMAKAKPARPHQKANAMPRQKPAAKARKRG